MPPPIRGGGIITRNLKMETADLNLVTPQKQQYVNYMKLKLARRRHVVDVLYIQRDEAIVRLQGEAGTVNISPIKLSIIK